MSDTVPDIDDPDIRAMIASHHEPHEWWNMNGHLAIPVTCGKCYNKWPCPSIVALREWKKKNRHWSDYNG